MPCFYDRAQHKIMSDGASIITLGAGESVTSLETPEGYFTQRHHVP